MAARTRQMRLLVGLLAGALAPLALGGASDSRAATLTLSASSSDDTPASVLDATLVFAITGASQLTLTVTNDTAAPDAYNMDGVWFNAASNVTGLTLTSATHSVEGDVLAAWVPVENDTMVDGFGVFDFGVTDGVGENNPNLIGPGESIAFVFAISGTGPYADTDFVVANAASMLAGAKFVNGPAENDPFEIEEDSAFGAVPEPGTAGLVGGGLLALALAVRRPRL